MNKFHLLLLLLALAGICLFSCLHSAETQPARTDEVNTAQAVRLEPVTAYDGRSSVRVHAVLYSEREAKLSFKTGGVVRDARVREGDVVRRGQLLATLDPEEIAAQVQQAEAGLAKAERDWQRVRALYADTAATLELYQNASTAYDLAKRTAEIARFNRRYSEIRSPIDGVVARQLLFPGEIAGPGMPVYVVIGTDAKDWAFKAGLVDRDWARVAVGDSAHIRLDAYPGKHFPGIVTRKSAVGANGSGTFEVHVAFRKELPPSLAAGLVGGLTLFPEKLASYPTIPVEALVKVDGNKAKAFAVREGHAQSIELEIAQLLGERVAISRGLEGIDAVITTGAMYLEDGDPVRY
ncbi:MAG: efflux RND transporter periplasmic adaptor subunit [Saprospiraceae bacterium]|nr:efflux RND transporter periplasmic adaptor subunit [Saprospiraceae bacterium]